MSKAMITTNQNFHSSINIAFDLPDNEKVSSFIPTASACRLIENLFMSVAPNSTNRAKILVGAYGRGKSHIVLMTLALLSRKDFSLFKKFFTEAHVLLPEFVKYVKDYANDDRRLLPVVITGNTVDLAQSFLQALYAALQKEGLAGLMPQTNMQGAIDIIKMWHDDYPDTLHKFESLTGRSLDEFVAALSNFDMEAYREFIEMYPALTSGSRFNNFAGLNVVDVYEQVAAGLRENGYDGLYVVYDEFSKYLEASIAEATESDVKLLQDFAEKCNRSGDNQIHLLLICHKDIANYIDGKLSKERVDGWRGVSGRFEHIEIRNGFAQSYELIESSIIKDRAKWKSFSEKNAESFQLLESQSVSANLIDKDNAAMVIRGCYPLHPVTTFLLPRISEKVAQNERTLFTYLTSGEKNSFDSAYSDLNDEMLSFVTPDGLYDYFEPLFRRETYTSEIHSLYVLTTRILARFDRTTLESKIVKTLMLFYVVAQFECLAPTREQVFATFSATVSSPKEIEAAIDCLIREEAVIYLRKSNGYLKLKESSGIDIEDEIIRDIERNRGSYSVSSILNEIIWNKAVYPSRHNAENEIVRYFRCSFIDSARYWNIQDKGVLTKDSADGCIFAVLPTGDDDLSSIRRTILNVSKQHPENVFILPKKSRQIDDLILRYKATLALQEDAGEDSLLADECDVLLEDYSEVISVYNASYFQPEQKMAKYYQGGKEIAINRKAQLSALLSKMCDNAYPRTPIINNEAINKNDLSPTAVRSRAKILAGLCSPSLEKNLGLQGNGQECSIMRSVFSVTGIIEALDTAPTINLKPQSEDTSYMFETIRSFIYSKDDNKTLDNLYSELTGTAKGIGLKRGLVILFLATVLREDWNNLLLLKGRDEQRLTAGVLNDVDCNPERYSIQPIEWTTERAEFVQGIMSIFSDYLPQGHSPGDFTQAVDAIVRWYLALPRFSKTATKTYQNLFNADNYSVLPPPYLGFLRMLKRSEINPRGFLFNELPELFGQKTVNKALLKEVQLAKTLFDNYVTTTSRIIANDLRNFFDPSAHPDATLASIIVEWQENSGTELRQQVFSGQTNRILEALRSFTSDEEISLRRLYKATTALRIEDWNERTLQLFASEIESLKTEIDAFANSGTNSDIQSSLQIVFVNDVGEIETRSFQSVVCSPRAKLLRNEIESALEEMGQSIDDSEKRQVLFEALREMC